MRNTSPTRAQELCTEHQQWTPPACTDACAYGWPQGPDLHCHCPALVARFGLQRVGVMRANAHACGDLKHFASPPSYSLN
ncbi:hypothetical protein [Paracidovorax citrulli]|uniref:hypothetical protein n=1 Tax=Paracidovorax citrulli TaxID=80869 RepID=UPI000B31E652|nr:hypothetical protein [Paracidovorax citrulli]